MDVWTQNNWYWSARNPHLTQQVPFRAVKFGNSGLVSTHSTNLYTMAGIYPPTVPQLQFYLLKSLRFKNEISAFLQIIRNCSPKERALYPERIESTVTPL